MEEYRLLLLEIFFVNFVNSLLHSDPLIEPSLRPMSAITTLLRLGLQDVSQTRDIDKEEIVRASGVLAVI